VLGTCKQYLFTFSVFIYDKRTKHKFIYLLTATFKDLHIENSKKLQKMILFGTFIGKKSRR